MTGRDGRGRGVRRMRPTVPQKMAIVAMCLFGAAGAMWAVLPVSEAGWYGEGQGNGGATATTVKAVPPTGTLTAYAGATGDGAGADRIRVAVEALARDIMENWASGEITGDEYIAAMSYLHGYGYLEEGVGGAMLDGRAASMSADGNGADGPEGSAQGWCKDGLAVRTDANTGDMVCVPYGYEDEAVRQRWIEPVAGVNGGIAVSSAGGGGGDGSGAETQDGPEITWQRKPLQNPTLDGKGGYGGAYASDLKERIADLESANDGLLRTIAKLSKV